MKYCSESGNLSNCGYKKLTGMAATYECGHEGFCEFQRPLDRRNWSLPEPEKKEIGEELKGGNNENNSSGI